MCVIVIKEKDCRDLLSRLQQCSLWNFDNTDMIPATYTSSTTQIYYAAFTLYNFS